MPSLVALKAGEIEAIAAYITNPGTYQPPRATTPQPPLANQWNTFAVKILGEDDLLTVLSDDNKLWFIKNKDSQIGYIDVLGQSALPVLFDLPAASGVKAITVGPDKRIWFTASTAGKIGAIDVSGTISFYSPISVNSGPNSITTGTDGNLWFTETATNKIGIMKTNGEMIKEISPPTGTSGLGIIVKGLNNTMWVVERDVSKVARVDVATGTVTEITLPSGSKPKGIAVNGKTGDIWVTDTARSKVMRVNPSTLLPDEVSVPLGKTPDRIMYCNTGDMYFTLAGSSKIGGIDSTGKIVKLHLLDKNDSNDYFRVHDLIEGDIGVMWFGITQNTAPIAVGASTEAANINAEIASVTEATLDVNVIDLSPPPATAQNSGGGGCTTDPFNKPDPTLPIILLAAVVYLRRKFVK